VRKYFQVEAEFSGYLRFDKDLWQQFGQDQPALRGNSFVLRQGLEGVLASVLAPQPQEDGVAHGY